MSSLKLIVATISVLCQTVTSTSSNDNTRWFPYSPNNNEQPANNNNPSQEYKIETEKDLYDPNHGIVMGVINARCDDGKHNLEVDWDFNPINYTCFDSDNKQRYQSREDIRPRYSIDKIPTAYNAPHRCMNKSIHYADTIPTFGTHRPLWAKYGEYTFLPRQRWLHNLEHGAIVMLYHPCANKNEVNLLRKILTKCLYRHIITPYNLLEPTRPIALVAWGRRLEMSRVSTDIALNFIKLNALKGPEQIARDGQYDRLLVQHASIVTDIRDSFVCKAFQ